MSILKKGTKTSKKKIYLFVTKSLLFILSILIFIDVFNHKLNQFINIPFEFRSIEKLLDVGLLLILIPLLFLAGIQKRLFMKYNKQLDFQDSYLQIILENMEEPVIACDKEGKVNYYNQKARKVIAEVVEGTTLKTAKDWLDKGLIFYPNGLPVPEEEIPIFKAYREGKLENYETIMRIKNEDKSYLANDREENSLGAIVVLHDITEQRQIRDKLIEIERKYQSLLDHNIDMIYEFDLEGRFVQMNKATEKISGYSFDELYQTHFGECILPEYQKSAIHCWNEALSGRACNCESVIYHKKGHLVHLSITSVPIIIENKISGVYGIARDITKNKRIEENMMFLAYHDMLTGLPNRLLFNERLQKQIDQSREEKQHFSVMFLDLDRFKLVNDTYGHLIGDKLIKFVSARLLAILDEESTVSRQGGDEFAILLTNRSTSKVEELAIAILRSFAMPFYIDDLEFFMRASMGIAMYPVDGENIETLLKNADTAMYQAKEKGKNSYQFYTREMNEQVYKKMMLEKRLHKAVESKGFLLYYQPKIHLKQGIIMGFEALIRWKDQDLGMIPPVDFIPIAEENGLIAPITEWVLETACMQIKKWESLNLSHFKISVNISAIQFKQQNIVEMVKRVLNKTGVSPYNLQLEITESVTQDTKIIQDTLKRFKELGVQVSIDDFGTGYSSLSYLKNLPIHELKIDKSFVDGILRSPKEAAILQTIITLGHSLGLNVVAEGIESREQLELLKKYGCDEGQGYYFNQPIPEMEMEKCLRSAIFSKGKILEQV